MALTIPPAVNYPSSLVMLPSLMQDEPKNGRKQIPIELDWGIMGGSANCISLNVQSNQTLDFEQISTIKVDNSQSGADVTFIFPDTSETITIPAGSPCEIVPVLSNALALFASAPGAKTGDVTRCQLLNYPVMPTTVDATTESATATSGGTVITGGAGGPIQVIPAGVNGTLTSLKLVGSQPVPGSWQTAITVEDGATPPRVFVNAWNFSQAGGVTTLNFDLLNFNSVNWRFTNGLQIQFTPLGGAGSFIANAFADYRQP